MSGRNNDYVIYALEYNPTKKLYIGSSSKVRDRYKSHIENLRKRKHASKELQADYNKHGEDFSVYILEEVKDGNRQIEWGIKKMTLVRAKEYEWMKKYDTVNTGYNKQDWQAIKAIETFEKNVFPLKNGKPPLPYGREQGG